MCEFCDDIKSLVLTIPLGRSMGIGLFDNEPHIFMETYDKYQNLEIDMSSDAIYYCPICGRKLVEE